MALVCLFIALLASSSSLFAQPGKDLPAAEKLKDWRKGAALAKEFEQYRWQKKFKVEPESFVKKFMEFDKRFKAFWKHFTERYGERRNQIMPCFEGVKQPLDVNVNVYSWHNTLLSAIGHDKDVLNWCSEVGEERYRTWKNLHAKAKPEKVELYLDYIELSLGAFKAGKIMKPDGGWDENIKMAQEAYDKQKAAFEENLANLPFPPHNPDWKGEGSPDSICAAAMDYLKKHPKRWGDAYQDDLGEPIAITLASSDWIVLKRNILKAPTCWRLDFNVAFASKSGSRYAYLFYYSMNTKEEAGIAKAPPFVWGHPHQYAHYKILASKVPGAGGASTTSGAGRLFWLALIAANIVAGLLAAAPMINKKVPQLAAVYEKLTPLRNLLGVVALAIGLICFLRVTILHFAPHADILPQISAIVAGLFLGKELLMKKPKEDEKAENAKEEAIKEEPQEEQAENAAPGGEQVEAAMEAASDAAEAAGEAAEKAAHAAQDLLIKHREKIEQLEKHQVPVGIACIVLGVLHLLIGGYPIF